ncbi:MAG: hypothetical protein JXB45_11970 [Candidatus Krumholzibacteriota bacterium]|nr:hypothetical protein [Candidatus Krumholzibacteriota bacterium]
MYRSFISVSAGLMVFFSLHQPAAAIDVYPDGSGDAPTIREALEMAGDGETVRIFSGTYYESNLVVDGKKVNIYYGDLMPVIEAPLAGNDTALTFRNGASGTIVGIHFRGFSRALIIEDAYPSVWNDFFTVNGTAITVTGAGSAPYLAANFVDTCQTGVEVENGSGVRIENHTMVRCDTGINVWGGTVTLGKCIIDGCGTGISSSGGSITFECNDWWDNTLHFSGCSPGAEDFFLQPVFCYEAGEPLGPYYLSADSPCLKSNNSCGYNLGAFSTPACTGVSTQNSTWGEIKLLYR